MGEGQGEDGDCRSVVDSGDGPEHLLVALKAVAFPESRPVRIELAACVLDQFLNGLRRATRRGS